MLLPGMPSALGYPFELQIFNNITDTEGGSWSNWHKPSWAGMVWMLAVGGGAGGGGGFSASAGNARGGGGGGGCSAWMNLLVPAFLIPDILYVQVGAGGLGVSAGLGGSGVQSRISVFPSATNTTESVLISCDNLPAIGGGTGTGAAVGSAGTGGTTILQDVRYVYASGGLLIGSIGGDGSAGGAVAGGTPATIDMRPNSPGCGGAGTTSADFAGGTYNLNTDSIQKNYLPPQAAAGSNNGSHGFQLSEMFWGIGGQGGGSSNTGVGGNGGNGIGYGCGGGGGGGGTTGGTGGDGGPGVVIIACW